MTRMPRFTSTPHYGYDLWEPADVWEPEPEPEELENDEEEEVDDGWSSSSLAACLGLSEDYLRTISKPT